MSTKAGFQDAASTARTLRGLAGLEAEGAESLEQAARRVADDALRARLESHAADEQRHADSLRARADELAGGDSDAASEPPDLTRGRGSSEVDAHGFHRADMLDGHGEVAYVAMLLAAEKQATKLYRRCRGFAAGDSETAAVFDAILEDEARHIACCEELLKEWDAAGRGREVSEGRAAARGGRFWRAWKGAGIRSGAGFSRVVLMIIYVLLLWPFGLLTRRSRTEPGWRLSAGDANEGRTVEAQDAMRSQY